MFNALIEFGRALIAAFWPAMFGFIPLCDFDLMT
jgi:hypothetical protein